MSLGRNISILFLSLIFLMTVSSGAGDILLNGTSIYLATGESSTLYQGYVLSLKSVSSDGSVWLQLTENEKIVKSEIVVNKGYFVYNKTNRTILSVKVDNVYSGSSEQSLVTLSQVYQFIDPDLPIPDKTDAVSQNPGNTGGSNTIPGIQPQQEPFIWIFGIFFSLILLYILRKLW